MADQYMCAWIDRSRRVAILRVRGELDTVTAPGFAEEAARLLKEVDGPVGVDLSILDFLDCAGARTLAAVLDTIPSRQLVSVTGAQRPVRRLLDLIGVKLTSLALAPPSCGELDLPRSGDDPISRAQTTLWQSRDLLLETSGVMARLATTYAEMAAARDRRAALEPAKTEYLRVLSGAARDLSAHYRQHARYVPQNRI